MKRACLLKTLKRFDRCSKICLARIQNDSMWTLNSADSEELAETSRQIALVQLDMLKLSRGLAAVSREIRSLVVGKARCVPMPAPKKRRNPSTNGNGTAKKMGQRSAFAARTTDDGAVVVRVRQDASRVWPQKEYGRFETWTQAQGFASLLNQRYGIDPMEAQHIVVSASLAAAKSEKEKI